jgi:hypothetical protein
LHRTWHLQLIGIDHRDALAHRELGNLAEGTCRSPHCDATGAPLRRGDQLPSMPWTIFRRASVTGIAPQATVPRGNPGRPFARFAEAELLESEDHEREKLSRR